MAGNMIIHLGRAEEMLADFVEVVECTVEVAEEVVDFEA